MQRLCPLGALTALALGASFVSAQQDPAFIRLRFASFDPLASLPAIPAALQSFGEEQLFIVQFDGVPTQRGRDALAAANAAVHGYLPDDAYVVRMAPERRRAVAQIPSVRWVGPYHAAFRIDPELIQSLAAGDLGPRRYNMMVVDKHVDKPALGEQIRALGGVVDDEHQGSLLYTATLTPPQLIAAAHLDQVLFIDAWSPAEDDVDNARIQGGANYVESQAGYSGATLNLHIYEGIDTAHPGFSGPVVAVNSSTASSGHGTNTAGIVFGDGTGNPQYRGFAPDAGKFFTNYSSVTTSRWQVFSDLVNVHDVSHTTASWGDARTFFYTTVSADADDAVFDHDIAWTQSQSNAGNQDSRPQAWAKNVFSIGGVRHQNNADPLDDTWSGSGSTGPASDGRIKPTLAAYYDGIGTTSQGGGYTNSFGGTSGATPIVAGHNALAIEMFVDDSATPGVGPFGNALRNPGGSTHSNRPHFTTLKCMMVSSASKYAFNASSTDNRREHVGWGFPNLQKLWDARQDTLVIDETDVLTQGQSTTHNVTVPAGQTSFQAVLNWAEVAGNPSAASQLVNDLSMKVTSPNGTVYWGNDGLEVGNESNVGTAAGPEDNVNSIECVFVTGPQAGTWTVEVIASAVVTDNHVETPAVDADYALVVSSSKDPVYAAFDTYGQGCQGSFPAPAYCATLNPNGGTLSNNTNSFEYCYAVTGLGSVQVHSFDIFTQSNSGTITRPAHIYLPSGGGPSGTPLATTTITVGATPGFYTATFATPVAVSGTFYIGYENSPGGLISNLNAGATGVGYYRTAVTGNWNQSGIVDRPSWRVDCGQGSGFSSPELGNAGLPSIGSSYDVTVSRAATSSVAVLLSGLSDSIYQGAALPAALPGAPGCELQASADVSSVELVSPTGAASSTISVPNSASLMGLPVYHQWAVLDTVNPLGIVVSDAGKATVGI
ncbi:MAG: S8 family serine peptidase [Planctomycetota bacterium]|nr:S8 family serine peptidase [Planctomycetota bacterium]